MLGNINNALKAAIRNPLDFGVRETSFTSYYFNTLNSHFQAWLGCIASIESGRVDREILREERATQRGR